MQHVPLSSRNAWNPSKKKPAERKAYEQGPGVGSNARSLLERWRRSWRATLSRPAPPVQHQRAVSSLRRCAAPFPARRRLSRAGDLTIASDKLTVSHLLTLVASR